MPSETATLLRNDVTKLPRPRPDILSTAEALAEERRVLRPHGDTDAAWSALCLSGGGIRSASFGLGVLQALAAGGLLKRFDYLSTVSGGGFIGGWLQMLIRERGGVAAAEAALTDPQAREVVNLRSYTNYLTPQVGIFSADTWTAVALYVRNLLLNWLVIVPVLMAIVLALIMHRTSLATFGRPEIWLVPAVVLAVGTVLLFVGTEQACLLLPSHRPGADSSDGPRDYADPAVIRRWIVYPILGWAVTTPIAVHSLLPSDARWDQMALLPACYAVAMLAAYGAAWYQQRGDAAVSALYRVNLRAWLIATVLASLTIVLAERWYLALTPDDAAQALTTFGPFALTLCHMLQAVIHVGLRQERIFADLDREWLARVDGMILLGAIFWFGFSLCCLDLAGYLIPERPQESLNNTATWVVSLVTIISGPTVAWIGKQAFSSAVKECEGAVGKRLPMRRVLDLLAVGFAIGLLALLGVGLQYLLGFIQRLLGIGGKSIWVFLAILAVQAAFAVLLLGVSRAFGHVDVNRFSMHNVYRNRLSRAFLGSAMRDRKPEPFSGFSPIENPRLASFADRLADRADTKLFPVINIALNLTRVTHTAWAERKAAPFTATPLHCGSAELKNPNGSGFDGAFVHTPDFAGVTSAFDTPSAHRGMRLGTALTISGAALSPNWGYQSSPMAAFLMTMFNVRLGAWLPNPAVATAHDLTLARPRDSRGAIFSELMGRATDTRQSMYLSDGGHFEDLGLYEMLRRRCTTILVVDAGEDSAGLFADLGAAIRKAEIDGLGRIEMEKMRILSRAALAAGGNAATVLGFAVGTVRYDGGRIGRLLYVKPTFLPNIPAEVRAYGLEHPDFPHESTGGQWFTESQFESYRALGQWQMAELVRAIPDTAQDRFEGFFDQAWTIATSNGAHAETPA